MIIVEGNVNCNALFKEVLLFNKKYEQIYWYFRQQIKTRQKGWQVEIEQYWSTQEIN